MEGKETVILLILNVLKWENPKKKTFKRKIKDMGKKTLRKKY